jgi:hypothetical protein
MITFTGDGITVHVNEPLPDGLSRKVLLAAIKTRVRHPGGFEMSLPDLLLEQTGLLYKVVSEMPSWVHNDRNEIVEQTLTLSVREKALARLNERASAFNLRADPAGFVLTVTYMHSDSRLETKTVTGANPEAMAAQLLRAFGAPDE